MCSLILTRNERSDFGFRLPSIVPYKFDIFTVWFWQEMNIQILVYDYLPLYIISWVFWKCNLLISFALIPPLHISHYNFIETINIILVQTTSSTLVKFFKSPPRQRLRIYTSLQVINSNSVTILTHSKTSSFSCIWFFNSMLIDIVST